MKIIIAYYVYVIMFTILIYLYSSVYPPLINKMSAGFVLKVLKINISRHGLLMLNNDKSYNNAHAILMFYRQLDFN